MITGTLEDIENDFLYIIKSARPGLTVEELQKLSELFRGGPRRPWEVINNEQKERRLIQYYKTLSAKVMNDLQDIYKWDVMLHSYKLNPW